MDYYYFINDKGELYQATMSEVNNINNTLLTLIQHMKTYNNHYKHCTPFNAMTLKSLDLSTNACGDEDVYFLNYDCNNNNKFARIFICGHIPICIETFDYVWDYFDDIVNYYCNGNIAGLEWYDFPSAPKNFYFDEEHEI